MGLSALIRRHVVMLRGADLFGYEALAFGLFWIMTALILIFFDVHMMRRSRLSLDR